MLARAAVGDPGGTLFRKRPITLDVGVQVNDPPTVTGVDFVSKVGHVLPLYAS
jgi:hypothetical protein